MEDSFCQDDSSTQAGQSGKRRQLHSVNRSLKKTAIGLVALAVTSESLFTRGVAASAIMQQDANDTPPEVIDASIDDTQVDSQDIDSTDSVVEESEDDNDTGVSEELLEIFYDRATEF